MRPARSAGRQVSLSLIVRRSCARTPRIEVISFRRLPRADATRPSKSLHEIGIVGDPWRPPSVPSSQWKARRPKGRAKWEAWPARPPSSRAAHTSRSLRRGESRAGLLGRVSDGRGRGGLRATRRQVARAALARIQESSEDGALPADRAHRPGGIGPRKPRSWWTPHDWVEATFCVPPRPARLPDAIRAAGSTRFVVLKPAIRAGVSLARAATSVPG